MAMQGLVKACMARLWQLLKFEELYYVECRVNLTSVRGDGRVLSSQCELLMEMAALLMTSSVTTKEL